VAGTGRQGFAAFHAVISGHVQGVGFRYSAVRQARALGVVGVVANLPDGSVDVHAEGVAEALERLLAWLRKGPSGSFVRAVQVDWLPWSGRFSDFDVDF